MVRYVECDSDNWADLYRAYLATPEWAAKREAAFAKWGDRCLCGAEATQVDHLTYRRIGNEAVRDLLPLCAHCHEAVTEERRVNGAKHGTEYVRVTEAFFGARLSDHLPLDAGARSVLRRKTRPVLAPPNLISPRQALAAIREIAEGQLADYPDDADWKAVTDIIKGAM